MKFIFDSSAVYLTYITLSCVVKLCCGANPVDTMKELLSCSGWRELAGPNRRLDIVDRPQMDQAELQLDVCQLTPVDRLLTTEVTDGNVADQIRLAHQFLSCSYARALTEVCDYERGIGPQCRTMDTASKTIDCLKDYLRLVRYKYPMVSRMIGALSSLYDLSPSPAHIQNDVFKVLEDLRDFCTRLPEDDQLTIREIAIAHCNAVEKQASTMSGRLNHFYYDYCRPISDWQLRTGCSEATDNVRRFEGFYGQDLSYAVKQIETQLDMIIEGFTVSHDATSGFEYDAESNTTRIITYDPQTAARVRKMNRLLSNRFNWISLKPLEIKEHNSALTTNIDDLLNVFFRGGDTKYIVTKENLYSKSKQAHQFLSCQYASVLKECCDHVTVMWNDHCKHSEDSVCLDKFLQILNGADSSVLSMIDALKYFYELSPDTAYNKGVFHLLERFRSFYNTAPADRIVSAWSLAIENHVAEIARTSHEFYERFCYSKNEFDTYCVDTRSHNTIDKKGLTYKNRLFVLTYSYAIFKFK